MEDISPVGHIVIYGPTYSGKTNFCKYLLNFIQSTTIYVFTKTPDQWAGYTVFTENFDEEINTIRNNSTKDGDDYCRTIVIFDDFNEAINTTTNRYYKDLFTNGRHNGIRVINIAQQAKAIGVTVRSNVKYIVIMATINNGELKPLADMFYNNDKMKLTSIIRKAREDDEYNGIFINTTNKNTSVYKAELPNVAPNEFTNTQTVDLPSNSVLSQNPGDAIYNGIGPIPSINVQNGQKIARNLIDNSVNNFNNDFNIKMEQKIETNNITNELKMQNLQFEVSYNLEKNILSTKSYINRISSLTDAEKILVAQTLNETLRPKKLLFDKYNFSEGVPIFMKKYDDRNIKVNNNSLLNKFERVADTIENHSNLLSVGYSIFNKMTH